MSITDRCNFRCTYCMPREVFGPGFQFLKREELLSFEEITRVVRVFAGCGRGVPETGQSSCCAFVFVDQAAEDIAAVDLSGGWRFRYALAR